MTDNGPESYSPLGLAYLGDAAYELLVREHILKRGAASTDKYMGAARGFVSAEAQSRFYALIEPLLSEDELDALRRGRNAKGHSAPSSAKKRSVTDYRRATGLEALFGYLHLKGRHERSAELFNVIAASGSLGGAQRED